MTHSELCELTARKFCQTFALWEVKGKWGKSRCDYLEFKRQKHDIRD